jgi:membrane protein
MTNPPWPESWRQTTHRLLQRHAHRVSQAQRGVRYARDLARYCSQQLAEDKAAEMAAALTYRTIFSLVPTIVLSLVVLRAFGGLESFSGDIQQKAFEYWGFYAISYNSTAQKNDAQSAPAAGNASTATTAPAAADSETLAATAQPPATQPTAADSETKAKADQLVKDSIGKFINDATAKVANIDFRSIGAVGLILLIWAALALAMTVEDSLNRVFDCPTRRAWHQRITTYWSVLTLAPVLLVASLYLTSRIGTWLADYRGALHLITSAYQMSDEGFGLGAQLLMPLITAVWWVTSLISRATAVGATWLLMFLLFTLMPNTSVNKRAALIGSFVGAILWEGAKIGFNLYVTKALPYSALYGSLGLIPLFLFWMYLTWLIVLFGAELTYSLQTLDRRRLEEELRHEAAKSERQALMDSHWLVPMLAMIGRGFHEGRTTSRQQLVRDMRLTTRAVSQMALALEEARLIHRVKAGEGDDEAYTLAQPPNRIALPALLDLANYLTLGRNEQPPPVEGWDWLLRLQEIEKREAAGTTLDDLLKTDGKA